MVSFVARMSEATCGKLWERYGETRMVNYRRNFVPGGTFFFTVTLANRNSKVLVDHVDLLRNALRVARQERPFVIDAVVVLPDHLHAIFTLPSGDSDFPDAGGVLKGISAAR